MDQALAQIIDGLRAGSPDLGGEPALVRQQFETMLATLPISPEFIFTREMLGQVPALRVDFPGARTDAALLYLHGGGYICGSANGYRTLAAQLARAVGVPAFAIDYRLAPEHPFPAALDDALEAYEGLCRQIRDPRRIVLAGDSAGGGLVLATLVALRQRKRLLPAAAVLISPWADLECQGESMKGLASRDPLLSEQALRVCASRYLAGSSGNNPLASPIHADLQGLPPLLVQVGSAEILLDDAIRVARAAGAAGTPVRLEVWPDMVHVWHALSSVLPAGMRAIEVAGQFMRSELR